MTNVPSRSDAEARVIAARARLDDTVGALQVRLAPRTLVQEAANGALQKGRDLTDGGIDAARRNPLPVAGALLVTGLLLFRKPLARLIARREEPDAAPSRANTTTTRRAAGKRKSA